MCAVAQLDPPLPLNTWMQQHKGNVQPVAIPSSEKLHQVLLQQLQNLQRQPNA